jgi:four helix bundle protein
MKSENREIQQNLSNRLLDFGVEIIRMAEKIRRNFTGRQIIGQLISSSTSAGANYEEACAAESRSDFVHKLQVVLKELRESLYWLRLISRLNLVSDQSVGVLIKEGNELSNVIAKSIVTAKRNR